MLYISCQQRGGLHVHKERFIHSLHKVTVSYQFLTSGYSFRIFDKKKF